MVPTTVDVIFPGRVCKYIWNHHLIHLIWQAYDPNFQTAANSLADPPKNLDPKAGSIFDIAPPGC